MAKETKNETAKEAKPEEKNENPATIRVKAKHCIRGRRIGRQERGAVFDLPVEALPAWKDSVAPLDRNEPALRTS